MLFPWINTDDKHSVTNFRLDGALNTISKIYETIVRDFIINKIELHFSLFVSAYWKSFSTEHHLIRLLEDWRIKLDNNNVVGAILIDLPKAFDCLLHNWMVAKFDAY